MLDQDYLKARGRLENHVFWIRPRQKGWLRKSESTLSEYENYVNMDAIVKYTAGITGVIFMVGETPTENGSLAAENAELKRLKMITCFRDASLKCQSWYISNGNFINKFIHIITKQWR